MTSPADYAIDGPVPRYVERSDPWYLVSLIWRGTIRLRDTIWLVSQLIKFGHEADR